MVIASFMGIPVLIIARENQNAFYFVFSAIIFVIVASVLGFIFVPKVQRWRKGEDEGSLNRSNVSGISAPKSQVQSQVSRMSSNLTSEAPAEPDLEESHANESETIAALQEELRQAHETIELLKSGELNESRRVSFEEN
jgi:hypothetical protein